MAWAFETEPEFEEQLEWMRGFVDEEVEPLDLLWLHRSHSPPPPWLREVIDPLKQQVKARGLWACHLTPELGGQGYGQVKLALMNEIIGRTRWAMVIFGCQGPDTGNAEILAHYGTPQQRAEYLQPLLDGELFSAFSMTEPQGGADPSLFTTRATRDGDEWVINGEKWFTSNAKGAAFFIVMAVTDPSVSVHRGTSMFLVPKGTQGIEILRTAYTASEDTEEAMGHAYIRYNDVRVPTENMLGNEGDAFKIAQTRLGGGRIHHAMRTVGICNKALEMMLERAVSRSTADGLLAQKQMVQHYIAKSYAQIQQFRLLVLYTAWLIDARGSAAARTEIAACKNMAAEVQHDVVARAIHLHGSLGMSTEMPLTKMWSEVPWMGVMDGPTEVHEGTIARQLLKGATPVTGNWPTQWIPERLESARSKHANALREQVEYELAHGSGAGS